MIDTRDILNLPDSKRRNIALFLTRLSRSRFRSSFHLSSNDITYIDRVGWNRIRQHAVDFISQRLAPANISNDGKQTPMRKHPVFIAQHATATCCRGCLGKWHHIEPGQQLSEKQIDYIVDVIMAWIIVQYKSNTQK